MKGAALAVTLMAAAMAQAPLPGGAAEALFRRQGFSAAEIRSIQSGTAVVKSLDTPLRRELAHYGVVHINISTAQFVERFRDIERFEGGPGVPQIKRFSQPPVLADLAPLTLPEKDVASLARCRPQDCDVKLSVTDMARFKNLVKWSAPDAAAQANAVARAMLLEIVQGYQANGNASLGRYEDRDDPVQVGEELLALIKGPSPVPVAVPELLTYLEHYPRHKPAGAEDLFYWAVVEFGLKPTVRLNHAVVYPLPARPSGISHVIAVKQLYASHYFQTTLELRFLIEDGRGPEKPGFYLVSITRARADGTTGFAGSLLRPIINRRSRNAVRGYLDHLKKQVESRASR